MAVLSSLVNSIVTGKENKMAVKSIRNSNIIIISSKMANIPPEIVQRCPPSMVMTSVVRHISPFSDIILDDDSSASSTGASVVTDRVEKSVQFNQNCYVKKTISRHNYTPQEIGDCWFSDEEYHETRSECIEKIQMLERGEELSSINDCVRGLDSRTQSATIAKQNNRLYALMAVLNEQYADGGPESIAEEYCDISHRCQLWARAVGRKDQLEAEIRC